MSTSTLRSIARAVLLREVREFVDVSIETKDGSQLTGSELVREIRNALWMPQGIEAHARLLLQASNIDPEREGSGEDRTPREIERGHAKWKKGFTPSLTSLREELELLDMHMEDFIRDHYGLVVGEAGPVAVKLRVPPGSIPSRRPDLGVAYSVFQAALRGSMRSQTDTAASRAAHRGGRYAPEQRPGYNTSTLDHDIVDAIIEDFMEILLFPEDASDRLDFDKAATRMMAVVDQAEEASEGSRERMTATLTSVLGREVASARAKLLRAEKERGASVPDASNHEIVQKISDVLKLFQIHIVAPGKVPLEEFGDAFSAILSKACGIDNDYQLPPSLRVKPIRPLLPKAIDDGLVDFIDAVHDEVERQVESLPTLKAVSRNILNPMSELYDKDGNPRPGFTYDSPHPAYA